MPLILVVEDNASILRAICRILEFEGYRCLPTRDAAHALELLGSEQMPDLLLIDVWLPGMSGPELALQIHERRPGLPVLFVSARGDGQVNPDTLTPLRWEYLPKPFASDTLVDRIQSLLQQSEVGQ
jgi:DNA-binding response OmpR family regulator